MRFGSVFVFTLWIMAGTIAGAAYCSGSSCVFANAGPAQVDPPAPSPEVPVPTVAPTALPVTHWTAGAPSMIKRSEAEGAAVGDKLYVFGGYSYPLNGFTPYSRVDMYDVATNTWTRLRDLPRAVNHAGVATDGRFVYLAGGYVANAHNSGAIFGTREVWQYDSSSDSYIALPPLPIERAAGQLVLLDRSLHYFGGTNIERTVDTPEHWALSLDAIEAGWQPRAPMSNARNHLGAVALNGKIWAVGGQHGHDGALTTQRDVEVYDPATDLWTAVAPLPPVVVDGVSYGRGHISGSTFVRDGKIVVAGGEYRHMHSISDIVEYDPQTGSWQSVTPLPVTRYSGVARQLGATFVYATGATDGGELTNTTWLGCSGSADCSVAEPAPSSVPGPSPSTVRINAGGFAQTVDGVTWSACRDTSTCEGWVSGGNRYTHAPAPVVTGVTPPANEALYQTEWTGGGTSGVPAGGLAFAFNVPVANGNYNVRLHFAENYQNAAGARSFDVNIEGGALELANFDVYAQAGGKFSAIVREFPVTISDGNVTIEFIPQVENALINGIEIVPISQ